MTPDELRAIEARTEAATPGPWRVRKGEGLWWTVEVELPSINGLPCWYAVARFDFDMAANGYTDGALKPEADAAMLAHARQDIPRLAAALRELQRKLLIADGTVTLKTGLGIDTHAVKTQMVRETMAKLIACESRAHAAEARAAMLEQRAAALVKSFDASQREDWNVNDRAADRAWLKVCRDVNALRAAASPSPLAAAIEGVLSCRFSSPATSEVTAALQADPIGEMKRMVAEVSDAILALRTAWRGAEPGETQT